MAALKPPQKTRVIFFGNERLATGVSTEAPTLRRLIAAGYDIAAVVSHNTESRSRAQRPLEIAALAEMHNIPVLLPAKPAEIINQLRDYNSDIGVLVAYGKIVPQSIIDVFPRGIVNIHPSLLPLHRGPIPVESVILNGAAETGVSVMQLVRAMDAGPVYGQRSLKLDGSESKQQLADTLLTMGGELLKELLPCIINESCVPEPQDDSKATYDELIRKTSGLMDFSKTSEQLEREVRAYLDWPKSRTTIKNIEVIITRAHTAAGTGQPGRLWVDGKQLGLYSSTGILAIDRLKPLGRNEMTSEAFLAGYSR